MLMTQFIGLNVYFGANLLAALVSFGVFWLIYDAWVGRRSWKEAFKWIGFLALSVGFLLRATSIQAQSGGFSQLADTIAAILRALGYVAIILGQVIDPLQPRPEYSDFMADIRKDEATAESQEAPKPPGKKPKPVKVHLLAFFTPSAGLALPGLTSLVSLLYWRRATTGLERHLLPVAWGFAGLTVFELLNAASVLQNTSNPLIYQQARPLGPLWWAALIVLIIASVILGRWVWQYLTKRLQSQLFMVLVTQAIGLFLFTTIGFTFLLLRSDQNNSLTDLSTASHVLDYAISSRQAETAAQAEAVASSGGVAEAVAASDHSALIAAVGSYLPSHGLSSLVVLDGSGQVLLRSEDPAHWGDSKSGDPLVRRALVGKAASNVVVTDGVIAPIITLSAATPVRDSSGTIVGAVITGRAISNAFVDGIRKSTGLDSTIYAHNIRSATTIVDSGGTDRAIGIAETNAAVTDRVLSQNKSYTGTVDFQNRPYLTAFAPLDDVNNVPVGMLLVARPASGLYAVAYQSIQITFLFVVALVIISIFPIFLLSRYLSRQFT